MHSEESWERRRRPIACGAHLAQRATAGRRTPLKRSGRRSSDIICAAGGPAAPSFLHHIAATLTSLRAQAAQRLEFEAAPRPRRAPRPVPSPAPSAASAQLAEALCAPRGVPEAAPTLLAACPACPIACLLALAPPPKPSGMGGQAKVLSSQFGTADCRLLACEGWDCEVLFPGVTLRVDGNWCVSAGCQGAPRGAIGEAAGLKVENHYLCASRARSSLPSARTVPRTVAPPDCSLPRLAGDPATYPALLIAHLLSGGASRACWDRSGGRGRQETCRGNATRSIVPFPASPRTSFAPAPGPCFFLRCPAPAGQPQPRP